jgi:hypothetical protein
MSASFGADTCALVIPSIPLTVKGELGVASFLVNFLSGVHFWTVVAVHPCPVVLSGTAAKRS